MVKHRKHIGLFLLVVYAFFFASTNFFYHSHQLANYKLVHSHPFNSPGHSHAGGQILLIEATDSAAYEESSPISVPDFVPTRPGTKILQTDVRPILTPDILSFSLRAPPASY